MISVLQQGDHDSSELPVAEAKHEMKHTLLGHLVPVGGFILGALLGAVGGCWLGMPSLFVSAIVLFGLIVFIKVRYSGPVDHATTLSFSHVTYQASSTAQVPGLNVVR